MTNILDACAQTDYNIKRGLIGAELGVELLIMDISR
jgi:hypothetical protein